MDSLISYLISESIFDFGMWSNWKYANTNYSNDGNNNTHISIQVVASCAVTPGCGQIPVLVWKNRFVGGPLQGGSGGHTTPSTLMSHLIKVPNFSLSMCIALRGWRGKQSGYIFLCASCCIYHLVFPKQHPQTSHSSPRLEKKSVFKPVFFLSFFFNSIRMLILFSLNQ